MTRIRHSMLCVALSLTIGMAACSNSTPSATSSTSTNAVIVDAAAALPVTFDPCFIPGNQTAEILSNIYMLWDHYKVGNLAGTSQPADNISAGEAAMGPGGMLDSWDVSSDGTIYTLHVHQGAKDTFGNPITADFMQWLLERDQHLGGCQFITSNLGITDASKQVVVVDDHTLKVTLAGPDPIFLRTLSINNGAVIGPEVRKHTTASDPWGTEWAKTNVAATGPYTVQSFVAGVNLVLVANPNYFGPKPSVVKITYTAVPEAANRVALLSTGQAQVARDLNQDQLDQIAQSPNGKVVCARVNTELGLAANMASGPTSNVQVRQAMAYAVPYTDIIASVYKGRAARMYGMVPSIYPDYIGNDQYPYNTDYNKAKQLLAAAGYANGFTASVLINNAVPEHERAAVLLQNSFKQVGVTLTIDSRPAAAYTAALTGRSYSNFAIWEAGSALIDLAYAANLFMNPGPPPNANYSGWKNADFTALATQAVKEPTGTNRSAALKQMQAIFNENLPWLSLAVTPTCFGFSKKVSGYIWHTYRQVYFADLKVAA